MDMKKVKKISKKVIIVFYDFYVTLSKKNLRCSLQRENIIIIFLEGQCSDNVGTPTFEKKFPTTVYCKMVMPENMLIL
jgi:hypothetical protein